jgi:hypothetical protein
MPSVPPAQALKRPGDLTGARLVGRVLNNWSHLPDLQFRALLRMAHTALDDPNGTYAAATYWGGHESIARTWRTPYPDGDSDDDKRRRRNILNEVRRVMRALEQAGAVKALSDGQPVRLGHAQRYLITV